ncbi:hypothetical protein FRC11_001193, partial [Ceratobasidium sp. 423]
MAVSEPFGGMTKIPFTTTPLPRHPATSEILCSHNIQINMKNFTLPDDPLLDEAAAAPSPDSAHMSPEPHGEGTGTEDQDRLQLPNTGSDEDETNAPNAHKRP